jgi:hypothetical protein|tara:strand:+ start:1774 stop:2121 length:348 start_codon:yes stop_codon:yes gene_type:complete
MNKKNLLLKLVHIPSKVPSTFWGREYRLLKSLLKKYPKIEFWQQLQVDKVDSLTLYAKEDVFSIKEKYEKFVALNPVSEPDYEIKKRKSGKDYKKKPQAKTIKEFLYEKKSKKRK